jgi:hypothetical protein
VYHKLFSRENKGQFIEAAGRDEDDIDVGDERGLEGDDRRSEGGESVGKKEEDDEDEDEEVSSSMPGRSSLWTISAIAGRTLSPWAAGRWASPRLSPDQGGHGIILADGLQGR